MARNWSRMESRVGIRVFTLALKLQFQATPPPAAAEFFNAANAKIPKIPGPAINYNYTIVLDADGNIVEGGIWGSHDPFPAHGASMQFGDAGATTLWDDLPGPWKGWGLLPVAPDMTIDSLIEGATIVYIDRVRIK